MPKKPDMKSEPDFRFTAQITNLCSSEWEDNVLFDADDPDFVGNTAGEGRVLAASNGVLRPVCHVEAAAACVLNSLMLKVPSGRMSLASCRTSSAAHLAELCSSLGRNSVSSSLSDLVGSPLEISMDNNNIVTIEELRMQLGSCFTCGVSWAEDHVSLDCSECGGYSMERPCPLCEGSCGSTWKRDFAMSHATGNARWLGCCPQTNANSIAVSSMQNSSSNLLGMLANGAAAAAAAAMGNSSNTCNSAAGQLMAHELCARLEKLSAQT